MEEVSQGRQRLDYYLLNVTNEQRYLYARTARHLRTAESTHARTLWYMLLICGTIILASFVQVRGCLPADRQLPTDPFCCLVGDTSVALMQLSCRR